MLTPAGKLSLDASKAGRTWSVHVHFARRRSLKPLIAWWPGELVDSLDGCQRRPGQCSRFGHVHAAVAIKREFAASFSRKKPVPKAQIYQLVKAGGVASTGRLGSPRCGCNLKTDQTFSIFSVARPRATVCRKKRQRCHGPSSWHTHGCLESALGICCWDRSSLRHRSECIVAEAAPGLRDAFCSVADVT